MRFPSVVFEFSLVSSLLDFRDATEHQEFRSVVTWNAWFMDAGVDDTVEPDALKWMARGSEHPIVAKGMAVDRFSLHRGTFRINSRQFWVTHVFESQKFTPRSIDPAKAIRPPHIFERASKSFAQLLLPLAPIISLSKSHAIVMTAAAVLLAALAVLLGSPGKAAAALGLVVAAIVLFVAFIDLMLWVGEGVQVKQNEGRLLMGMIA